MMNKTWMISFALGVLLANFAAGAPETQDVNLAAHRPVKAFSTYEGSGWSLATLTDAKWGGIGWSSKAFTAEADHKLYPEYVVVDLGRPCELERVVLHPRADGANTGKGFPADFTIEACREGEAWNVVAREKDYPEPAGGQAQVFTLTKAEGRYVKVAATRLREVEPGKHYFQLAELEVFGRDAANPPLTLAPAARTGETTVGRLRCENRDNPVGMDAERPRLSWWMQSLARGQRQTAYRVRVASSRQRLDAGAGDQWDSGKVAGDASLAVPYGGAPLQSGAEYFWQVMLWDKDDRPTAWSEPARFVTGKLQPADWKGQWIGADVSIRPDADTRHGAVYLRKEIEPRQPVKRATVFFCGLGFSELSIDGRKVGEGIIEPGFTTYNKRTQYLVFDVTDRFQQAGRQALGVTLVDGWYGLEKDPWVHHFETNPYVDKPKLLLDLELEYQDGTVEVVTSGPGWKWSNGEITRSWIAREDIDRRLAHPGWDRPGYDDAAWRGIALVKGPEGRLVSRKEPPCRIVEEIHPVRMRADPSTKSWTFDFGREITGWVRLRTKGAAGTTVTVTTIPTAPHPRPSTFILAGTGQDEIYEPRFFYAGMQQVEIRGAIAPPSLDDVTACLVSSSWPPSGAFCCSDDLANWFDETARRTVIAYTTFLPMDPVREWKAWVQDIENMFCSSVYLFDSQTMYERWQYDLLDSQNAEGNFPNVTPGAFYDAYNSPWWGGCAVWLPWYWYRYYGDATLLKASYPAMKRYVDYLGTVASDGLQDWGLMDWLPVEETPRPIVNTPAHYLFARIVSDTAALLGNTEDARRYAEVAEKIRARFNQQFLDPATGIYGQPGWTCVQGNSKDTNLPHEIWWTGNRPCTQSGQALPLALGLVPDAQRKVVEQALLREIAAHHNRVSSGFVATPYLLELLADLAPELGWTMTSAQDYPSWYSISAGSDHDLFKETWAGGMALMPSLGGNITAWQTQALAGIRPDPQAPGFKRSIIKPNLVGDLHWVECHYDSVYGRIVSNWRRRAGQVVLDVTVPANTTATVYVPTREAAAITESGQPASQAAGVKLLRTENGSAIYEVGAGAYEFSSTLQ